MKKTIVHPDAPKKLVRAFRRAKTFHATADALGVNVRYVHDLLVKGIEPINPEVRVKLFLPRKPRRPKEERRKSEVVMAEEVKWWRGLAAAARRGLIRSLWEMRDSFGEEQE